MLTGSTLLLKRTELKNEDIVKFIQAINSQIPTKSEATRTGAPPWTKNLPSTLVQPTSITFLWIFQNLEIIYLFIYFLSLF